MDCYVSGILGLGMIMASLSTMAVSNKESNIFKKALSVKQNKIYNKISTERKKNYFHGLVLGQIIAIISLIFTKNTNKYHRMSMSFAITFITTILYYGLITKSDYMLNHLKTSEEIKAWLKIYKIMKERYISGFLLGVFSSLPISYMLC